MRNAGEKKEAKKLPNFRPIANMGGEKGRLICTVQKSGIGRHVLEERERKITPFLLFYHANYVMPTKSASLMNNDAK